MNDQIMTADQQKFAYHEGARLIRAVLNRVCELAYLDQAPSEADRDSLCDSLIELHQILYGVTLFMARDDEVDGDEYAQDELYAHGGPVITRASVGVLPDDTLVPPHAYHGVIGEEVPAGVCISVWRPGERTAVAADDHHEPLGLGNWKLHADLRSQGFIEWARDDQKVIVKRCQHDGRLQASCSITEAGLAEFERMNAEIALARDVSVLNEPDNTGSCDVAD